MTEYKQPETRIKRVKEHNGERFYAQYKQVIIPHLWWEWQNTRPLLEDDDYSLSLEDAKDRIDQFLRKSKRQWTSDIEQAERRKIKPEVEYIKYP